MHVQCLASVYVQNIHEVVIWDFQTASQKACINVKYLPCSTCVKFSGIKRRPNKKVRRPNFDKLFHYFSKCKAGASSSSAVTYLAEQEILATDGFFFPASVGCHQCGGIAGSVSYLLFMSVILTRLWLEYGRFV